MPRGRMYAYRLQVNNLTYLILGYLTLACCSPSTAQTLPASTYYRLADTLTGYVPTIYRLYLTDTAEHIAFERVVHLLPQFRPQPLTSRPSEEQTAPGTWHLIPIYNVSVSTDDWVLSLMPWQRSSLHSYVYQGAAWRPLHQAEQRLPQMAGAASYRLKIASKDTLYLLYHSFGNCSASIKPLSTYLDDYYSRQAVALVLYGYLAMCAILLIYSSALFITTFFQNYLYYTVHLLGTALFIWSASGIHSGWLAEHLPIRLTNTFLMISLLGGLGYTRRYLLTYKDDPRRDFGLRLLVYLGVVLGTLTLLYELSMLTGPWDAWISKMLAAYGLLAIFYEVFSASMARKLRRGWAGIFILAYLLLGCGQLYYFTYHFFHLGTLTSVILVYLLGSSTENIFISIALGNRIRLNNHQRLQAQRESILALEANRQLMEQQNRTLEAKVEERTLELETTLDKLETTAQNLTDSLRYASHIQQSMLPSGARLKQALGEYFVLYRPRDLVSGDFYWCAQREDKTLLALVDCTGHGVPGALMAMVGEALLSQVVSERGITRPDLVLTELHRGVQRTLDQGVSGNSASMDVGLCLIDTAQGKLHFAGAKTHLLSIAGGEAQLVRPDRWSVGGEQDGQERYFTLHTLPLKGSNFYLFSDGITDQFGGQMQRKYGRQRLVSKLLELGTLSLAEQGLALEAEFARWQDHQRQLDDVLVIGFKLPVQASN